MWIKCWLYSVINSASSLYVTIFYNFALVCDVFLADISHNLLEKVERCGGFSLPNSPPPPQKKTTDRQKFWSVQQVQIAQPNIKNKLQEFTSQLRNFLRKWEFDYSIWIPFSQLLWHWCAFSMCDLKYARAIGCLLQVTMISTKVMCLLSLWGGRLYDIWFL